MASSLREGLFRIIVMMAEESQGVLRIALREADDSTAINEDNDLHFFKLNGRRLGRDLRDYAPQNNAGTDAWRTSLSLFIQDIVMKLHTDAPGAFKCAGRELIGFVNRYGLYKNSELTRFRALFDIR